MPHIKSDPTKPVPDIGLRGIPLLDKIIEYAETMLDHFDMKQWAVVYDVPVEAFNDDDELVGEVPETCGTALCVAGWAAHLTGMKLIYERDEDFLEDGRVSASRVHIPDITKISNKEWHYSIVSSGNTMRISAYAQMVLGLSMHEAEYLFSGENSLEDVKRLRNEYAQSREDRRTKV